MQLFRTKAEAETERRTYRSGGLEPICVSAARAEFLGVPEEWDADAWVLLSTLGGSMAPGDNRVLISLIGYRNAQIEVRRRPGLPGIDLEQAIMRAREYRF